MGMGGGMGMNQAQAVGLINAETHPHVRMICRHCNSTHMGPMGKPLGCHHCVCEKCNGSGWNHHKGHKCMVMEVRD